MSRFACQSRGLYRTIGALGLGVLVALGTVPCAEARAETGVVGAVARPPGSDIQVTMTASPGFATGTNATYTLTAHNNGPQSANGPIVVVDTLPAGLSFTSASGSTWTCTVSGQEVTCTHVGAVGNKGTLPDITIVAAITNAAAASVTNIATITNQAGDDSDLTNNRATVTSAVTVRTVTSIPNTAPQSRLPSNGTVYTDTFVVRNTGNVADSYLLTASVAPAGVVRIISVNGVNGTSGTTGALVAGATSTVIVRDSVATGAAAGATATLTLTATSATWAPSTAAGNIVVTVVRAGIAMTKQLYRDDQVTLVTGAAGVAPGEYVQYKVTVTNGGGASASTVSVSDPIPAPVTYASAAGDAPGWTITNVANTVTASLAGTLASGASRFFWIRVRVK